MLPDVRGVRMVDAPEVLHHFAAKFARLAGDPAPRPVARREAAPM